MHSVFSSTAKGHIIAWPWLDMVQPGDIRYTGGRRPFLSTFGKCHRQTSSDPRAGHPPPVLILRLQM